MSTLEDKILGEKMHYYCSSSEDEGDDERGTDDQRDNDGQHKASSCTIREGNPESRSSLEWEGYSVNTGPKGVIKDWQRYKQIEIEQRKERELERIKLIERLSLNCSSHLDDEKHKANNDANIELEFDQLLNESDGFLKDYIKQRMEEMIVRKQSEIKYGQLEMLNNGGDFLNIIEKSDKSLTIICHISNLSLPICKTMNGCLKCLAEQHPYTRFITIEASAAGMSNHFIKSGVPALLAYKGGHLIGNFVSLSNEFGDDFYATDVEEFLVDHGLIPDSTLVPEVIRSAARS